LSICFLLFILMTDGVWSLEMARPDFHGPSLLQIWPIRKKKRKEKTTGYKKCLIGCSIITPVLAPRCRHFAELRAAVLRMHVCMYVLVPFVREKATVKDSNTSSSNSERGRELFFFFSSCKVRSFLFQAVTQTITRYHCCSLLNRQKATADLLCSSRPLVPSLCQVTVAER
jgi:hypothetical protein